MKYFILIVFSFFISFSLLSQKEIVCKSGQTILLDAANNFISSNANDLVANFPIDSANYKFLYQYLLSEEKENRLKSVSTEKEIFIAEYDLKRESGDKKQEIKSKIAGYKKILATLNKAYALIQKDLSAFGKKDSKTIDKLLIKYKTVLPELPTQPVRPSETSAIVDVIVKDDYPDDKVEEIVPPPLPPSDSKKSENKKEEVKVEKDKKKNKDAKPVLISNQSNDCKISFNGRNPISKEKQIVLEFQKTLTYTPEKVKNYYKHKDFLTINSAIEKTNKKYYINLEAKFSSKDILKSYGTIHKSDFLRMEFVSGKKLFLKAIDVADPYLEPLTGNSVFKVKYEVENEDDFDTISKEYLDKLGIMWSSGFESYPVYDVDFFHRQIDCLKSEKQKK